MRSGRRRQLIPVTQTGGHKISRDQVGRLAEATANSAILTEHLGDFTKKTGIDVQIEQAPVDSLTQKAVLDFTTKRGSYDVISFRQDYLGSYAKKGYIEPITTG